METKTYLDAVGSLELVGRRPVATNSGATGLSGCHDAQLRVDGRLGRRDHLQHWTGADVVTVGRAQLWHSRQVRRRLFDDHVVAVVVSRCQIYERGGEKYETITI